MSVANEHTLSLAGWHMFNVDAAILSSIALCQSVACKYCTYRCCMICGFIDRPTGSLSARCVIKQPCLSQHVMMMNRSVIMSASHASPLYLFTTTSSSSVSSSDASKQLVCWTADGGAPSITVPSFLLRVAIMFSLLIFVNISHNAAVVLSCSRLLFVFVQFTKITSNVTLLRWK